MSYVSPLVSSQLLVKNMQTTYMPSTMPGLASIHAFFKYLLTIYWEVLFLALGKIDKIMDVADL